MQCSQILALDKYSVTNINQAIDTLTTLQVCLNICAPSVGGTVLGKVGGPVCHL